MEESQWNPLLQTLFRDTIHTQHSHRTLTSTTHILNYDSCRNSMNERKVKLHTIQFVIKFTCCWYNMFHSVCTGRLLQGTNRFILASQISSFTKILLSFTGIVWSVIDIVRIMYISGSKLWEWSYILTSSQLYLVMWFIVNLITDITVILNGYFS